MSTVIEIYPKTKKPPWLKVGTYVEVLGEGKGYKFKVVEVDTKHSRAAVRHSYGDCWESFTKLSLWVKEPNITVVKREVGKALKIVESIWTVDAPADTGDIVQLETCLRRAAREFGIKVKQYGGKK